MLFNGKISRYRIVTSNNPTYPYAVLRRRWFVWGQIDLFGSLESAQSCIRTLAAAENASGQVLFEYSAADLIVDKLSSQDKSS